LRSSYGDTADIVAWLTDAQRDGCISEERLGDLTNEVQHQGGTSTAMYAVATHFVALARRAEPSTAIALLTQAGLIYANSAGPGATPCPIFLREEFAESALGGSQMLAALLPRANDFDTFKGAVAAIAGFMGHHEFARLLDGLDFYEGQFHHAALDCPFPPEI
jgi:hypothetical protein